MRNPNEAIIVIGHPSIENGQPGKILKERLDTAVSIYSKSNPKKLILANSSMKDEEGEIQVMRNYCIETGVNPEHIILEPYSLNTYDTAMYCSHLMNTHQLKGATIVASNYHKLRVHIIFKHYFDDYKIATPALSIKTMLSDFGHYIREFILVGRLMINGDKRLKRKINIDMTKIEEKYDRSHFFCFFITLFI